MHEQTSLPLPITTPRRRRQAAFCLTATIAFGALAVLWLMNTEWFLSKLAVPYPMRFIAENYRQNLIDFPYLLLVVTGAFALLSATLWESSRRPNAWPDSPFFVLPSWATALLLTVLLGLAAWFSYRNWLHWGKPRWDDYWKFGEILNYLWRHPTGENWAAIKQSLQSYPHAASPLTPLLISLLLFLHGNSLFWLQILNFAATIGSLLLLGRLGKKVAPALSFWILGALFLTNAATMRNAFFIQLDAVSSFFVLLFFALWRRRLARPTLLNAILLGGCLILAVLQKTTLFPLLAVPLTVAVFEAARDRIWNWPSLIKTVLLTVFLPLGAFLAYLYGFGFLSNFSSQVEIMGTGWNELDFSLSRFVFATGFMLGPYLPLIFFAEPRREPLHLGLLLFIALFFLSIVAVRGPFWSRYYSHILAPTLLLAVPHLSRAAVTGAWRPVLPAYLLGVAAVQYAMLLWHIF